MMLPSVLCHHQPSIELSINPFKKGEEILNIVKLPAHRAGLPGNEISFLFVPLEPAYKAGLAGHLPVKGNSLPREGEIHNHPHSEMI
jgi:hypothetical protein